MLFRSGKAAFSTCSNLKNIKIPKGVTKIESFAFSGCKILESIEIPDGVTEIENSVFEVCKGLINVIIPASVIKIGESAFSDCESFKSIEFKGNKSQWEAIDMGKDCGLGSCTVHCADGDISLKI